MADTIEPWDHTNTDELVCPYCGHEHRDSWEFETGDVTWCDRCEREFRIAFTDTHTTYTTEKIEGSEP